MCRRATGVVPCTPGATEPNALADCTMNGGVSPQDASDPVPARSIATAADIATLIAHLRTDPNACWVIPYVRPDFVWRDHVVGRAALGALDTCLANLGSEPGARVASEITGRQFFRVSEARAAWRTSTGDEAKYRLLEQYIDDARNGRLADRTITLFDDGHPRVVDGNKRAVAIYETAADPVTVPLFVVRPPG